MSKQQTCSDCGLSAIPRLEVVYVGGAVMCRRCAYQPPKRITMYVTATGMIWWNDSAGGAPVEYVRADLAPETKERP